MIARSDVDQVLDASLLGKVEAAVVDAVNAARSEPDSHRAVCELLIGALSAAILVDHKNAVERARACGEILLSVVASETRRLN